MRPIPRAFESPFPCLEILCPFLLFFMFRAAQSQCQAIFAASTHTHTELHPPTRPYKAATWRPGRALFPAYAYSFACSFMLSFLFPQYPNHGPIVRIFLIKQHLADHGTRLRKKGRKLNQELWSKCLNGQVYVNVLERVVNHVPREK